MINTISGYAAQNGCYNLSDKEVDGRMYNLVLRIFRDKLYDELFPRYDTWTRTITSYEGVIHKIGDIVLTGKNRKPLIADKEKIIKVPVSDDILSFDKFFYYSSFGKEATRIAKEIRNENLCLCGWERFVCGTIAKVLVDIEVELPEIVINCIYGLELR
jgi:hypothetical protein